MYCINRTLIKQRLLVEFSCEYPTLYFYFEIYSLVRLLDLECLVVAITQVMYFRLCNLPETFQWMMNSIFQELLYEGVLTNYIDSFVILAKTMDKLKEWTIFFLRIVEKHNLYFK